MTNAITKAGVGPRQTIAFIMDELKDIASRHNDEIVAHVMSRWISLRSQRACKVFAELRPSKERIQIFVLPPPREFGPDSIARRAPKSQGWGWFKTKFIVNGNNDAKRALRLLRISYVTCLKFRRRTR